MARRWVGIGIAKPRMKDKRVTVPMCGTVRACEPVVSLWCVRVGPKFRGCRYRFAKWDGMKEENDWSPLMLFLRRHNHHHGDHQVTDGGMSHDHCKGIVTLVLLSACQCRTVKRTSGCW